MLSKKVSSLKKVTIFDDFVNSELFDPLGFGMTVVHFAAHNNNPSLVKQAISFGADLDKTDNYGLSALFYCRTIASAQELIEGGANPNVICNTGDTAVSHIPIKFRDLVKYLVGESDMDLSGQDGHTLLQKLIFFGNKDYDLIDLVLSRTKNKNALLYGETLLFHAAREMNNKDIILLLANSGMDIYFRNSAGYDFYDFCYKNVQKEIRKQIPEFMKKREIYNACNKYNI